MLLDGRRKSMQPMAKRLGVDHQGLQQVSISAVTDAASCPLSWRLFVPERWDDECAATPEPATEIAERRVRAGIPAGERHREKWRPALDMIDELADWGWRRRW